MTTLVAPVRGAADAGPVVVLDVPFVAQTEALCGGAAAAMLLRYWGVADVQPEDFGSLLDDERRGIPSGRLAAAIAARGLDVRAVRAGLADLAHEIGRGRPAIVLLDAGGGRLHYVVVMAAGGQSVLVHDPALGPYRVVHEDAFLRQWSATRGLALLAEPRRASGRRTDAPEAPTRAAPTPATVGPSACDSVVDRAVIDGRGAHAETAVPALSAAAALCPRDARPLRELAGVRFRQERWDDAAEAARAAVERDPADADTWRLFAASRYLSDARGEALDAWNRVGEPRIDRVRIDGLARTRQDVATAAAGLGEREVLTSEALALAERRLAQLPSAGAARVTYRPLPEGRADVVASVDEPGLVDTARALALRLGADALARREARVRVNSPTGRGERLELGGRFLEGSPAAWARLDTPRLAGLPGVATLSAHVEEQAYAIGAGRVREARRRGALDWSDWRSGALRVGLGLAVDRFDGASSASLRAEAERRAAADRVAVLGDAAAWRPLGGSRPFAEAGVTVAARSSVRARRVLVTARIDARRASAAAPLALWPGAGTGTGRPLLLRASPLRTDGAISGEAFGRGLLHATVEAEARAARLGPAGLGFAAFADWARAWDRGASPGASPGAFAVGVGLRLRLAGEGRLRVDVAHRPGGRGVVASVGWLAPWPH